MDYGLRLTTPSEVPADPRDACPADWRDLLPPGRAVALYFGTEFCEDRLPDLDDANAYCAVARAHGLEPTLTTPLVSPEGLLRPGEHPSAELTRALGVDPRAGVDPNTLVLVDQFEEVFTSCANDPDRSRPWRFATSASTVSVRFCSWIAGLTRATRPG